MKKRKIPRLTAGITAGMMFGAAVFIPGCGFNGNIYGPPPEDVVETATPTPTPKAKRVTAPTLSPTPSVTASPTYAPEENIPETVYGPPEDYQYTAPTAEPEYDPEENVLEDVYGPPEYFEDDYYEDESYYEYGYFDEETGEWIDYVGGYYYYLEEYDEWVWVDYDESAE